MPLDFNSLIGMSDSSLVLHISDIDCSAIKLLYDNCKRMGYENFNVSNASIDVNVWLPNLIDTISKHVKIITKNNNFVLTKIVGDKFISKMYQCTNKSFDSEENLIDFIHQVTNLKDICIFYIVKHINLIDLKSKYNMSYVEIESEIDVARSKKIDFITNGN